MVYSCVDRHCASVTLDLGFAARFGHQHGTFKIDLCGRAPMTVVDRLNTALDYFHAVNRLRRMIALIARRLGRKSRSRVLRDQQAGKQKYWEESHHWNISSNISANPRQLQ